VRWKGVSLNCRRSSGSEEIRKIGSNLAAPEAGLSPTSSERPAALAIPATKKEFDLGGVAVKLAALGDILALLRRHFRCIRGARYAARAQLFPGDLVLGLPVLFARSRL
jgi:hypothetical protein